MTATEPWWAGLKSITLQVAGETPRLWPRTASPEYREARTALLRAEQALRDQVEAVAQQRRELPRGAAEADHVFTGEDGPVTLDELFDGHDQLLIYHLMLHPEDTDACAACSMFVDGLRGVLPHLAQHCGFAVVAPAPIATISAWGRRRGWAGVRLVSAQGTAFVDEVGVAGSQGALFPAFSVHARDGAGIRHVVTVAADFPDGTWRGMDLLSPVWNALDLLPAGRGEWDPDNSYER